MRDMVGVGLIGAGEHHTFVFAWGQVHPLVMFVNLAGRLRPNFRRAVSRNVEQARIRMLDPKTALFNAVAEDHRVQSHADSYRYCALYPGRIQSVSARADPTRVGGVETLRGHGEGNGRVAVCVMIMPSMPALNRAP